MTITQFIRAFGSRLHEWDTPRPRAKNWNKYGWKYWKNKEVKPTIDLFKLNALL